MFTALAIGLYAAVWILLIHSLRKRQSPALRLLVPLMAAALVCHGISAWQQIALPDGYRLSFFNMGSLFFWVINLLVLASSIKKPLHNLLVLLLPLAAIVLLASLPQVGGITPADSITPGVAAHILLSIIAYSILTMAAVQALLLAFQNYQLRHKHPTGWVRLLPPLQTMESLLFQLLWTGQILLTLAIVSGAIFIEDMFAQHLVHKTIFALIAWCVYAALLWGHYQWGWRGNNAVRWTLFGFTPLALAYFGSKFVLELILAS